jgi:heme-degrading monooxygenase HmoA
MSQLVIIRPVHFIPGQQEAVLKWSKDTEHIRRAWGMIWQSTMRGTVDHNEYLLIQMWESKEAYARWKASPDRAELLAESSRMVLHDLTRTYEVL